MTNDKTQKRVLLARSTAVEDPAGWVQVRPSANIDSDFHGWLLDQAASLRRRDAPSLDWDNWPRNSKRWAWASAANSRAA